LDHSWWKKNKNKELIDKKKNKFNNNTIEKVTVMPIINKDKINLKIVPETNTVLRMMTTEQIKI